ncbi:hypothetical protein RHMOL_Rhmol01G0145800 [Rhododendron molle]|uniref:Uncharacterized protein n=1 Tax=Rhododendron molle TaxID=49168 RepID=A0ACC0Q335_RHOML|nr:hypothetical protein RHMOL_Rhmol01G0145800 [Rhododendron molle]
MIRESMKNILKAKLGVSGNAAEFLTRHNAINIMQSYEMFSRRMMACCICLLAAFLLVPSVGQPSPLLVGVAAQIEAHKDVAPLVLTETLIGLDVTRAGRTRVFGGSPLLLQVWLCDKLNLLTPPANDDDIAWRCHWLRLPAMTMSNMGSPQVFVAGLVGFTFYSPLCILHQLGLS